MRTMMIILTVLPSLFICSAADCAVKVGNTICPVMGEKVTVKDPLTVEHKGKIYNLCCWGCVDEFKKYPEKFASKFKEIKVTTNQFRFSPDKIIVNKGDIVKISLTSADVPHGLRINEYGINLRIKGKETKSVEFLADKAGKFKFYCSVLCGAGHKEMKGELIVK